MQSICLLSPGADSGLRSATTNKSTALLEPWNDILCHQSDCCVVLQYWLCNVRRSGLARYSSLVEASYNSQAWDMW